MLKNSSDSLHNTNLNLKRITYEITIYFLQLIREKLKAEREILFQYTFPSIQFFFSISSDQTKSYIMFDASDF